MPNIYPAKVGRTVNYRMPDGRVRPAVIITIASNLNITASARSGGVVTLTVNNALAAPRYVVVNVTDATFNGVYLIASANATTITYNQPGLPNVGSGGTGTVRDADIAGLRVGHHGETYIENRRHGFATRNDRWSVGG